MSNWQRKTAIIILLLVVGISIFGVTVQAKGTLEVKEMEVNLKPEYDSPDVLATYDAYVKNTSSEVYSGVVKFLVPKNINLGSVCEITNAGQHNCQLYDVKEQGDKKLVTWKTGELQPGEEYHAYLEYYFDPLQISGNNRELDFNYETTYPVQELIFKVAEPSQVSNFTANLEEAGVQRGQTGLTDHFYKLEGVETGERIDLTIEYQRSASGASVTKASNQSTGSNSAQQASSEAGGSGKNPVVIILAIAILAVMIYFIYYTATNDDSTTEEQSLNKQKSEKSTKKSQSKSKDDDLSPEEEKKRARQLLLDGKISEKTYQDIVKDIEDEE